MNTQVSNPIGNQQDKRHDKQQDKRHDIKTPNPTEPKTRMATRKYSANVLVIEDDADVADLTRHLVAKYSGAQSDWAEDSYAAMDALYEHHYDYVIVDQNLPGLRGLQVLSEMDKAIDNDPVLSERVGVLSPTRVLFMSGAPIEIPKGYSLKHFVIQDVFQKSSLGVGLARNLAS